MEKLEKKLLEKDRDIRIKFIDDENKIKESEKFNEENFETLIQKSINEYYASEEYKSKNIQDEEIKEHEGEMQRSRYLSEIILKGEMKNLLCIIAPFKYISKISLLNLVILFIVVILEIKKSSKKEKSIFSISNSLSLIINNFVSFIKLTTNNL